MNYKQFISMQNLKIYERMLRETPRSDFTEEVSKHLIKPLFISNPEEMKPILEEWSTDEHLQIRSAVNLIKNNHPNEVK